MEELRPIKKKPVKKLTDEQKEQIQDYFHRKVLYTPLYLEDRSKWQTFVDWVHENQVASFFSCLLLLVIPLIPWVIARVSENSTQRAIDNFKSAFEDAESKEDKNLIEAVKKLPTNSMQLNAHMKINKVFQQVPQPVVLTTETSKLQNLNKATCQKIPSGQSALFYRDRDREEEKKARMAQEYKNQRVKQRIIDELPQDRENIRQFLISLEANPDGLMVNVDIDEEGFTGLVSSAHAALCYLQETYKLPKCNDNKWYGLHKDGYKDGLSWHRQFCIDNEKLDIIFDTWKKNNIHEYKIK